jgi:hypothetical protein
VEGSTGGLTPLLAIAARHCQQARGTYAEEQTAEADHGE